MLSAANTQSHMSTIDATWIPIKIKDKYNLRSRHERNNPIELYSKLKNRFKSVSLSLQDLLKRYEVQYTRM